MPSTNLFTSDYFLKFLWLLMPVLNLIPLIYKICGNLQCYWVVSHKKSLALWRLCLTVCQLADHYYHQSLHNLSLVLEIKTSTVCFFSPISFGSSLTDFSGDRLHISNGGTLNNLSKVSISPFHITQAVHFYACQYNMMAWRTTMSSKKLALS